MRWNRRKEVKVFEEGKIKTTRPREDRKYILVEGRHDSILEEDLYNKMIEKIGSKSREGKKHDLVNPFAGLLYCKNCGRAMSYRTYKNRDGTVRSSPRLLCDNQVKCKTKSSEFSIIYNSVIDSLEHIVQDFQMTLKNDQGYSIYELQNKMVDETRSKLKELETRYDKLYDFLEDGTYTKAVFLKREEKLKAKMEELETQLEYLETNIIEPVDYKKKIYQFDDVIAALKNDDVSAKEKNILLKNIIEKMEYYRNSSNRTKWDTSKPEITIQIKDF